MNSPMSNRAFAAIAFAAALAIATGCQLIPNEFFFSAAYTVLLYVILATAWNILGGYTGYVNFGSAAFFAIGAYTTVALFYAFKLPLLVTVPAGTAVAGLAGLGLGYVTLRLRGVFFAIASLAMAVVLFTFVVNWDFVGGARGAYVIQPSEVPFGLPRYIHLLFSIKVLMAAGALVVARAIETSTIGRGLAGFGLGYLTLRLRGVFFAIASLALAVVLFTFVVNWEFVGGARGAYVLQPDDVPFGLPRYIHLLFAIKVLMAAAALVVARSIETSTIGRGLAAIRDDELAAESAGVPTLRLKILSATISGALMGMAGTTFPYYLSYIEPSSAFSLSYAVNSIAMPLIGGMMSWMGPLIGAVLLGTVQQLVQVTISSAWNLLIVGVLLVLFVTLAPNGIMGWVEAWRHRKKR